MANWLHINAGYDTGDETILFGTRAFAETEEFIYETSTFATIQADTGVDDPSLCSGAVPAGVVCVSTDSSLTVFEDRTCSTVSFANGFDSKVDTFCFSSDSRFLFVVLGNGFIHCLHVPTGGQVVFSKKLHWFSGESSVEVFSVDVDSGVQVFVVCSSGVCASLQTLDLNALHTACLENNEASLKKLVSKITLHVLCEASSISPIKSVTILNCTSSLDLLAVGQGVASVSLGIKNCKWVNVPSNHSFVKVQISPDKKMCFALTSLGHLMFVCPETLNVSRFFHEVVHLADFQLFLTVTSETVVIAISLPNANRQSHLLMLSLQEPEKKFSLPIKWPSRLMNCNSDLEDLYFLECASVEDSSNINLIAIKAAVQVNPKFRMERMLTRRKFKEAEALAKNFGLDMTPIHKAMTTFIINKMQPWKHSLNHSSESNHELMQSLMNELDQISDLEFVCECCSTAIPPDYNTAYSLLAYAQKRVEMFVINNPDHEVQVVELSEKIFSMMLRLETMNLVKNSWDVEQWLTFCSLDLTKEVQTCLKQGDLFSAATIWSRHDWEIKKTLNADEKILDFSLEYLLECIPAHVSLDELLMWLKHMLPLILAIKPTALVQIVEWSEKKICGLERSHSRSWPEVGLKYCSEMLELFSSQEIAGPFHGVECSPLYPLILLRSDLKDINLLRTEYYVHYVLEEYKECRQAPVEAALFMLDRVDTSRLAQLIDGFLNEYVLEHKLLKDDVICHYISVSHCHDNITRILFMEYMLSMDLQEVLQCSVGWWNFDSAPWETRILELVPHISNLKLRLTCTLKALEVAPIPWSSAITSLAESALRIKHPLSSQVLEKQKQVSTNLILKKYKLRGNVAKLDKQRLIRNIIKANRSEMLEDITQLAKDSDEKVQFYRILIVHLVSNGNIKNASEILWSLPKDITVILCPRLVPLLRQMALSGVFSTDFALEYLGAIELCHKAAVASCPVRISHVECLDLRNTIHLSRNMLYLKRDFGKTVTVGQMCQFQSRMDILLDSLQNLLLNVSEVEKEEEKAQKLYQQTSYLARILSIPQVTAVTELVYQILSTESLSLAAFILGHVEDVQDIADNFYPRLITLSERLFTECRDLKECPQQLSGNLKKVAQEAFHLLAKASTHCCTSNFNQIVKIIGWIQCWNVACEGFTQTAVGYRDALQQWRITPLYKDPGIAVLLDHSILIRFMVNAYDIISAEDDLAVIVELPERAQKLQNDQHDLTLLLFVSQLLSHFLYDPSKIDSEVYTNVVSTFTKVSEGLLTKIVSARQSDVELGLNLLLNLGQDSAVSWLTKKINSSVFDLNKQKQLATLGMNVCTHWKVKDKLEYFQQVCLMSAWGLQLPEYGIPCKELFRDGDSSGYSILRKLIASKNVSVSIIKSFCRDYGFETQNALSLLLETILVSWDPDPIITVDSKGTKVITVRHDEQELFKQCWDIRESIEDDMHVRRLLYGMWEKVSFYNHEVFLVILDLLEKIGGNKDLISKRHLTTFLKSYMRVKPPSDAEEELWTKAFPSSYGLPVIAQYRLPYSRALVETPLSVIKDEINLDTYKNWLPMELALNITKDKMCTLAVHQTVTEVFAGVSPNSKWCETIRNEALFTAVAECVAQMNDVLQAAATLFFYTNKTPPGADQVSAAQLCLKYADEVMRQTGESEYKLKVERKYLTLATTQVLYSYGLGQPCYLQMVNQPEELIQRLYQHPVILESCQGTARQRIDINSAVDEICDWNSLCPKTLRVDLVQDLLQPEIVLNANSSMEDDTVCGMSLAIRMERHSQKDSCDIYPQSDDNLLRARYIMESGDVQDWALLLISVIFGEQQQCTGMRLRALQCVCMLTDDQTLEDLSGRTASNLRQYYRLLNYINELEHLGLAYSESGFQACDKKELALLIIRSTLHLPRAVHFLLNLCRDYGVKELSVWSPILQQMVNLAMIKELEHLLPQLTSVYQLWNLPSFKKAWSLVVVAPFTQDVPQHTVFHALELFSLCPVTSSIGVEEALNHCLDSKQLSICALLLSLLKPSERLPWMEKLFKVIQPSQLQKDLESLSVNIFLKNKAMNAINYFINRGNTSL